MKTPVTIISGPLAWQKFGNEWCLTGQYEMRPIFLCVRKGQLALRDSATDLLVPFSPEHPDAKHILNCLNASSSPHLDELRRDIPLPEIMGKHLSFEEVIECLRQNLEGATENEKRKDPTFVRWLDAEALIDYIEKHGLTKPISTLHQGQEGGGV